MVEREIDHPSLLLEVNPATDMAHLSSKEFPIIDVKKPDEIEPTNQHAEKLYGIMIIEKRWRAVYVEKGKRTDEGIPVKGIIQAFPLT
jgi:hypothetical protein